MKPIRAKSLREMLGCSVNYHGREGVIVAVDPSQERRGNPSLKIVMSDGRVAILRPSEIK